MAYALAIRTCFFLLTYWVEPESVVRPYAPELFSPAVSGAVCGYSKDGQTIYFAREDTLADKIFLYQASDVSGRWSGVQILPFSGRHNDLGARVSGDGNSLYFTSDRPGGSALENDKWNVWVSRLTDGVWSEPQPILEINNGGLECCVVPLPNGELLFSGDRGHPDAWSIFTWREHGVEAVVPSLNAIGAWQWPSSVNRSETIMFLNSMKRADTRGKDDVYVSFYRDGQWSSPVNLGSEVNSDAYEDGAILSPDEEWLIFCRHMTGSMPSQVVCVPWKPLLARLMKQ
jgi:hypothetical protein